MSDFKTSGLVIPNTTTHLTQGIGRKSAIFIEMESDLSAAASGAEYDILGLVIDTNHNRAVSGGGTDDLSITLADNTDYKISNPNAASPDTTQEVTINTAMDSLAMDNFLDAVYGKYFFLVLPVYLDGVTKRVRFGNGYWKQEQSVQRSGKTVNQSPLVFVYKKYGTVTPTFPAIPANTDTAYTTDAANKDAIGWLLAAADSTKGGYGTAVAVPSTSVLTGDLYSTVVEF